MTVGREPTAIGPLRILIVEDDTLVGMGLRSQLERLGHEVVGQASTASEASGMFQSQNPDLVLLDIRLDGVDGIDLAKSLMAVRRVPMIIISAYGEAELIDRASAAGVFGYLIKPVTLEGVKAQIDVAVRRFADQQKLIEENQSLTQTLEMRKLVEKAKGIFMKRLGLSEEDAHRRLQQESQRRRVGMGEIVRKIIESEEIMGGG
ncbi:MAG: response regulator [Phycisphaerales bacterium]|nr:response regulator [Phycisphaerales bacterium]